MPLCCAADSPSSEPARGGEPRPVSLVRWRRQLASAGSGCGHHVDEGGCRDSCGSRPTLRRPSPTADPAPGVWGEPRSSSLMVYGGGGGGSPFPPAAIPIPPRSREVARPPQHGRGCAYSSTAYALSPQRLSVLAVPLRGVFQVLTTQGDRGQKDPHLPRLLGWRAPALHNEGGFPTPLQPGASGAPPLPPRAMVRPRGCIGSAVALTLAALSSTHAAVGVVKSCPA